MADHSVQTLLAPVRSVVGFMNAVEDWLGLFFGVVLVIGFGGWIVTCSQLDWADALWPRRWEWIVAGLFWLFLDVPYLWQLAVTAHKRRKPFALQVAVRKRLPTLLLRPLIGIWWLGHFAVGIQGASAIHARKLGNDNRLDLTNTFFMVACLEFAANGFLMLGVCALTSSKGIRRTVWRLRVLIDFGLALLSVGLWH
jgi:hypothetical protein